MKTKLPLGKSLLFLFFLAFLTNTGMQTAKAQFGDAGEILRGGTHDANLLLKEYLRPFGSGFGADLNSGWINTARPYKTLGFDFRVNIGAAFVPVADQSFNVDQFNFQRLERVDGSPSESQTAFGEKVSGSEMGIFVDNPYSNQREMVGSFVMPEGFGFPYVPAPMAQLTVGLIKDTDVSVRYIPTVEVDNFSAGLYGIGVNHGLNQWVPGGSLLPVDLSVQAGFTKLNSDFGFNVLPEQGNDIYNPHQPDTWNGQHIAFEANGFTGNLLVGKNLPFISVYGGIGFQTSDVTIRSPGSYPIVSFNPGYDPNSTNEEHREKIIERIDDPVNISYANQNSVQALAGFRIRLTILTISGSYTLSEYPVANLGVGLSFR